MGYIYVIGLEGAPLVKIGSTQRDPAKRLQALQTGVPYTLKLLHVFPCDHHQEVEYRLHDLLRAHHARGEWFEVDLEVIAGAFAHADQGIMPPEYTSALGQRLKQLRERRGLSRRQLENAASIPHGVLSRIERDLTAYPSVPAAMRLAKVLGVTLDYLCGMYEENVHA